MTQAPTSVETESLPNPQRIEWVPGNTSAWIVLLGVLVVTIYVIGITVAVQLNEIKGGDLGTLMAVILALIMLFAVLILVLPANMGIGLSQECLWVRLPAYTRKVNWNEVRKLPLGRVRLGTLQDVMLTRDQRTRLWRYRERMQRKKDEVSNTEKEAISAPPSPGPLPPPPPA